MTHAASDKNKQSAAPEPDAPTFTLVQISDLHLKSDNPDRESRANDVIQIALDQKPDVIVLSGDLTEDGFDSPEDLDWAKAYIHSLTDQAFAFFILPGNHDIGNKTGQGPNAISANRLMHWTNTFGSDHFVHDLGNWRLIGLNSLLIGSGLPEEHLQLSWFDQMLDQAVLLKQHVAVFMHEPPYLLEPGQTTDDRSDYWPIAAHMQPLYMERLTRHEVKLVATGHVHAYRAKLLDGVSHVWCPSPAFIIHDQHFDPTGEVAGLIVHTLSPTTTSHRLIEYNKPDTKVIPFNPAADLSP